MSIPSAFLASAGSNSSLQWSGSSLLTDHRRSRLLNKLSAAGGCSDAMASEPPTKEELFLQEMRSIIDVHSSTPPQLAHPLMLLRGQTADSTNLKSTRNADCSSRRQSAMVRPATTSSPPLVADETVAPAASSPPPPAAVSNWTTPVGASVHCPPATTASPPSPAARRSPPSPLGALTPAAVALGRSPLSQLNQLKTDLIEPLAASDAQQLSPRSWRIATAAKLAANPPPAARLAANPATPKQAANPPVCESPVLVAPNPKSSCSWPASSVRTAAPTRIRALNQLRAVCPDGCFGEWVGQMLASGALEAAAQSVVVYSSALDSMSQVRAVATRREPTNVAMDRQYDLRALERLVGFQVGGYSQSSKHQLMPNISVYCHTPLMSPRGATVDVHVINLVGFMFDNTEQPDYQYFFPMTAPKRQQLINRLSQMLKFAFECARRHNLKHLHLPSGAGATTKFLDECSATQYSELLQKAAAPLISEFEEVHVVWGAFTVDEIVATDGLDSHLWVRQLNHLLVTASFI